jgi:hypothetical protein
MSCEAVSRKEGRQKYDLNRASTQIQAKKGSSLCNGYQKNMAFLEGVL